MIDLDALAASCHQHARPTTADALLGARTLERVYVITDLGPCDQAAIFIPAELGPRVRPRPDLSGYSIDECTIMHSGPRCPGPRCTWTAR